MKKHKYRFFFYKEETQVAIQDVYANDEEQAKRIVKNTSNYSGEDKEYTYRLLQVY